MPTSALTGAEPACDHAANSFLPSFLLSFSISAEPLLPNQAASPHLQVIVLSLLLSGLVGHVPGSHVATGMEAVLSMWPFTPFTPSCFCGLLFHAQYVELELNPGPFRHNAADKA